MATPPAFSDIAKAASDVREFFPGKVFWVPSADVFFVMFRS